MLHSNGNIYSKLPGIAWNCKAYTSTLENNSIILIYVDMDNGTIEFEING